MQPTNTTLWTFSARKESALELESVYVRNNQNTAFTQNVVYRNYYIPRFAQNLKFNYLYFYNIIYYA